MAYHIEKSTGDLVIDGFANGIAPSPHKGLANIQAANISTETGEVMCNYARVKQTQSGDILTNHTITASDSTHLTSTNFALANGVWINITDAGSISGLSTGVYYVQNSQGIANGTFQISSLFNGSVSSGFGSTGTATYNLVAVMGNPIASATEKYTDGNHLFQYRYYVLDGNGLVWVYDTGAVNSPSTGVLHWFLPDTDTSNIGTNGTGLAVLNGWLLAFSSNKIYCKPTVILQSTSGFGWQTFTSQMVSPANSPNPHFALTSHGGSCYYTDGNFIGKIFPNNALLANGVNIQSYASYTSSSTTGTLGTLIGGSLPTTSVGTTNIPAVFFSAGTIATALSGLSGGTSHYSPIVYISYAAAGTFTVASTQGGSALDITTGASGTQYFNTFFPINTSGEATITFTPQKLNLPFFETATCLVEIGDTVVVGCKSNVLYPWNQVDPTAEDLVPLPENNVVNMITVNNMAYVFAGNKGNIYVTNGSTASLALTVPDYVAGIPGTPASYIEPYFTWGGAMYLRGRVWFSIQDQTSAKAGNCGGVWSFVPTQNFFIGQDSGLALRLENQNSYGSYNGVASVLIPSQTQNALSAQYWSAWSSSISSPTYGIDFTDVIPSTPAVIETDLIPTGTLLQKKTFSQIEYKLAAPLIAGETVSIKYRQNATDAYASLPAVVTESATGISGYFPANFEKGQWLQLLVTLTPLMSTSSSFVRLSEIRVR